MSLNDPANRVRVKGHAGPHPREYPEEVYRRLRDAIEDCASVRTCKEQLTSALGELAEEITTPGSRLNLLVGRSP